LRKKRYRLVDLSHVIEHGMVTYKGLPVPVISEHTSREASRAHYAGGTEFHVGKIEMVTNTGTYLDTPFHRYAHGDDLSQVELSRLADLEGVVFTADSRKRAVGRELFADTELEGRACSGAGTGITASALWRPISTGRSSSSTTWRTIPTR